MHPALLGALVGFAAAAFFVLSEYMLLSKAAKERAKRQGKKIAQMDGEASKRMRSIILFSIWLPPALALGFWIVMTKMA